MTPRIPHANNAAANSPSKVGRLQRPSDLRARAMQFCCPECRTRTTIEPGSGALAQVICVGCGSSFNLIDGEETVTSPVSCARIAQFELLEEVGRGAHGAVWKARDTHLDRIVALKVPHRSESDPREAERVRREARAAAQLKHPNIVAVFGVGEDVEAAYLVEEYLDGVSLDEWVAAHPPSCREAAELCMKLAGALDHAHSEGVVHRDLKPRNVIIDSRGEPHITDFGLAKRSTGEETVTIDGHALGTPAYMSPEQANGEGHFADGRSDVYSLGVILYEMLTGERPFRGSTRMVIYQVLNEEPRAPRSLNDSIPRNLEAICLKAMAKEPKRRYGAAHDLFEDLSRFLQGRTVSARPVNVFSQFWLWCQRPERIRDAGTFEFFLGIVLSFWTLWGLVAFAIETSLPGMTDDPGRAARRAQFHAALPMWIAWECVWLTIVWIGWATRRLSRSATWCGLAMGSVCAILNFFVRSGTYELGMGDVFSEPLLVLLFILALSMAGTNVLALVAHFSNPNAVRWLRHKAVPGIHREATSFLPSAHSLGSTGGKSGLTGSTT